MKTKAILICLMILAGWMNHLSGSTNEYKRLVVAADGSGDYTTVQEAINNVRAFDPAGTVTIFIRNGIYKEKTEIYSYLTNVRLIGESRENTIITFDHHANIDNMGTFRTYTLLIRGNDIHLENLTIENNAEPKGQAVALHQEGDRITFHNCRFLGNQDTIYTGREGTRCYFEDCYIEGTTDFIFGPSTCWFERCYIHAKVNSFITAASTPEHIPYGYIFNDCTVTLDKKANAVHLGRPWRAYAMTLFMNCELPEGIKPEGWDNWRNPDNELTARYMEYNNSGSGASTTGRVHWSARLTPGQAAQYTIQNVLKGSDSWYPQTKR